MRTRAAKPEPEPLTYRDEAVEIPASETRFTFDFDEATVRSLASGICPEALAERMWRALDWEREQRRVDARARAALRDPSTEV